MRLIQINLTPKKKKKKVPTYPKHTRKQFQLVKQEESEAHRLANEKEEETALHYTVKQHGTSSHMHHSVTGFCPSMNKGH